MKDYFNIKREFLRNKNADLADKLSEDFKKALNSRQFCSALSGNSGKLVQFRAKIENLFHRINSVGFAVNQMKEEEKYWEKFIEIAFHPERMSIKEIRETTDLVVGAEEPTTLEFAFEGLLFFLDATFEYLSQAIGVVFSNKNVKKISKLKKLLHENYPKDKLTQKITKIIGEGEPLWAEIQERGVRDFFENVEPYVDTNEGKSLRDIVGHYRAIKVSPIQMTVGRTGGMPGSTLKAGSWKAKMGEKARIKNPSVGLVNKTEDYVGRLMNWIKSLLELTYGIKSTSF